MKSTFRALLAPLALLASSAHAVVLDFESFDAVTFQHGTVVVGQYDLDAFGGVEITATNDDGNGPDHAVIFDSNAPHSGASDYDTDLMAPFYSHQTDLNPDNDDNPRTMPNDPYLPGNILIIQENDRGCSTGICSDPDDEGRRAAGLISFDFTQTVELLGIDFFDVEGPENGTTLQNRIDIYDSSDVLVGTVGHTPDTGGDNLWARVIFDSVNNPALKRVGRLDIHFGGSGALDNLEYNVVPVPASVWLFGTALVGFIGFARRRTI